MDQGPFRCVVDLRFPCGSGRGLAVSIPLGLLVLTDTHANAILGFNLLHVYEDVSEGAHVADLSKVYSGALFVFGGPDASPPKKFRFYDPSGFLAFVDADSEPLLLVSDGYMDAVHVLNVVTEEHCGYVGVPGAFSRPAGVATAGKGLDCVAAVVSHKDSHVHIFTRANMYTWTQCQVISCDAFPFGVRLNASGTECIVVRPYSTCALPCGVSWYSTKDGTHVRRTQHGLYPADVEIFDEHRYFITSSTPEDVVYLMDVWGTTIQVLGDRSDLDVARRSFGMLYDPIALCLLPHVGILIRSAFNRGHVSVYITEETVRKITMSAVRVEWMAAVMRAIIRKFLM